LWNRVTTPALGGAMESMVPCGESEILGREDEGRGQVEGVEAAEPVLEGKRQRAFGQWLVDLDDSEGRPLGPGRVPGGGSADERHCPQGLDETDSTDEPSVGALHRVKDDDAPRLGDVPLDQGTGIDVEVQRPASRSAKITADALRGAPTSRGGRAGGACEAGASRPSATS